MKWVARSDVKVDRVARPWLIRTFIDPDAEFLFVPEAHRLRQPSTKGNSIGGL
jgi:hypothetical protein